MIAVDTNILVYAHHGGPHHDEAFELLRSLAESDHVWAIPWPCVHEFISVATNTRIFLSASSVDMAIDQIRAWSSSPSQRFIAETDPYLDELSRVAVAANVVGPVIHDARIAAICLCNGVTELWTKDRDFSKFPTLKTRDPIRQR